MDEQLPIGATQGAAVRPGAPSTSWTPGRSRGAAIAALVDDFSRTLGVSAALITRQGNAWRFESESLRRADAADDNRSSSGTSTSDREATASGDADRLPYTGLADTSSSDWLLIVPGSKEHWRNTPDLDGLLDRFGRNLEAAVQLHDEQAFGRLHKRLFAFVRRLTRLSGAERTHACILDTLARETNATFGSIAVFSKEDQALRIEATYGYPRAIVEHVSIAVGEGIIGSAYAAGRAELLDVAAHRPRRLRYRTAACLAIPLRACGRTLAVVCLADRRDGQPFDPKDLEIARLLAAPAALALERVQTAERLDDLSRAATVDAVTTLFNRRYFESRIEAEVQRARRQQHDLALLMVDIDDFKRINDTFGHLEGDRALRGVADLLRRGIRVFDVCARYGGEEFAIVMPGATRLVAEQVAERIRQSVEEGSRLKPIPMTVSIGVGLLGEHHSTEELVALADRALIDAKRSGKNVVKIG